MSKLSGALRSVLDVRTYLHSLHLAHYWSYAHVRELRTVNRGADLSISPTASFRNGERITLGDGTHVGEFSEIWAGDHTGRVTLGRKCLLAPRVMITASNYGVERGVPVMDQPKLERDVVIGDDVWLGAGVTVTAGVVIGDGVVVGAGAVVTKDLPPYSIAGGVPARVIGWRPAAAVVDDAQQLATA